MAGRAKDTRHPGPILHHCASGGRRLDFEMMRRGAALWRSDRGWGEKIFPRNVQAMTHGLSLWLPRHGLGTAACADLALRGGLGSRASFALYFRDPASLAAPRRQNRIKSPREKCRKSSALAPGGTD